MTPDPRVARRTGAAALPRTLAHGGTIARRQTTFWDVAREGERWRIHFDGKKEFAFAGAEFDRAAILESHPLLIDHTEPWQEVVVSSAARDPAKLLDALRREVRDLLGGWRQLDRYLNASFAPDQILSQGWGQLLRAPKSVVATCRATLDAEGIRLDVPAPQPVATAFARPKILLLGRSYVIADSFRVVPVQDGVTGRK